MIGTSQLINAFGAPVCFTDTTDIFKDGSGVALYGLDYDGSDAGGASGKFGEAAIFNGSSSNIDLPLTSLFGGKNTLSVSFWFNTTTTSRQRMFTDYAQSSRNCDITIDGGNIEIVTDYGSTLDKHTTTSTYNDSNWHHLVVAISSTQRIIYIDNTEVDTITLPSGSWDGSGQKVTIGAFYSSSSGYSQYFDGKIDQVRIFNTSLIQSQVTQLYQENSSTVGTHLFGCVANYNLDGNAKESMGTTAYDGTETNITYRYDGTPTNVDFGIGGKSNYGARFNGSTSYINTGFTWPGGTQFSISTWINTSNTKNTYICGDFNAAGANAQHRFSVRIYNQVLQASINNAAGGLGTTITFGTFAHYGEWAHLVVTVNGASVKGYVNGSQLGSTGASSQSLAAGVNPLTLGMYGSAGTGVTPFDGSIDQVRIFNKELSSAEVGKLYGNGAGEIACTYTSTTDNLAYPIANTAYYKLDNNSKDSARATGKFNEGAIFNGSSSQIVVPTVSSIKSYSFWIKGGAIGNNYGRRLFGLDSSGYTSCVTYIGSATSRVGVVDGSGNVYYSDLISDGNWHHVVVTTNGTDTLEIYTDGNLSSTNSTSYFTSSFTHIGSDNSNRQFSGSLDQVRIYDTQLDSTDVSNLYAETVSDTSTLSFPSGKTAIATYQLDGNSTDLSGNYNGTDTNITYAYDGTETNIEYRFGRFGQAAVFNGSSSAIVLPNDILSSDFSISTWFNLDSNTGLNTLFEFDHENRVLFRTSSSDTNLAYIGNSGYFNHGLSFSTSQWYHLVITFSAGNPFKIYVDGVLSYTGGNTSVSAFNNDNILGAANSSGGGGLDGKIDQVRIYSSALTSSQVTELYNEKPEVDTSNFKTVLYEGNGGTNFISNVGFQPDLVWVKARDDGHDHVLYDTVRGVGAGKALASNENYAEGAYDATYGFLDTFEATGFVAKTGSSFANYTNKNNESYVAWCWKAGGTAVTNNEGAVTSQVSANTAAGFSIVGGSGNTYFGGSLGHGLNQPPELIIYKDLANANNWYVYHKDLTTPNTYYLHLDLDNAQANYSSVSNLWDVTSTTFSTNLNITRMGIAYCWHSVAGYSRIGSYEGQGSGTRVYTTDDGTSTGNGGFKPSFIMLKNADTGGTAYDWFMYDVRRDDLDGDDNLESFLTANNSTAETISNSGSNGVVMENDGFKLDISATAVNGSGDTFLYMAFK